MKYLSYIERVALVRWSTLAFMAALVLPLLFLRYGNAIAVAQSALSIMLPIATAGPMRGCPPRIVPSASTISSCSASA